VRRILPIAIVALVALAASYLLVLRDSTVAGELVGSEPVATIGSGSEAVAVAADGTVLRWFPLPEDAPLPALPLTIPPEKEKLAGTLLDQARVLGAAPAALRPSLARSYYGESGVDVELRSGIELRFGDTSRLERKWRAATAVLADPSVTALDYVDLHAPSRPAISGSGHELPPIPKPSTSG
jgi:cell division septal protein FtsQ